MTGWFGLVSQHLHPQYLIRQMTHFVARYSDRTLLPSGVHYPKLESQPLLSKSLDLDSGPW
jgi:hypothetical protein